MKKTLAQAAVILALATPVHAACYADYQAKSDNPLRLHYGVIELSDDICARPARVEPEVERRLEAGGWTLLSILSTFGSEGLNQRRADAGQNFLRF